MKYLIIVLAAALGLSRCNMSSLSFLSSDKYDGNYREACRNMDFEAAHKILDKMVAEKTSIYDDDKDVIEATDYIFNAESLYLVSQNTSDANTRVVYLLSELPIKGRPLQEGEQYHDSDEVEDDGGYTSYMSYVNRFNSKCLSILNTAISVGNQEIAEKMLSMIKEDAGVVTKNRDIPGEIYYTEDLKLAHYTTESKDKAKQLYKQAVQEGKFK